MFDQYLSFVALEAGLFSLSMPDSYLQLNDPAAQDTQIEASVTSVVDGLFSALVTLGVVPIIRCPKVTPLVRVRGTAGYCRLPRLSTWLGSAHHVHCCSIAGTRLSCQCHSMVSQHQLVGCSLIPQGCLQCGRHHETNMSLL